MGLSASNERKGAGLATGPRLLGGGSEIRADARQYGPPRIVDRIGRIIIFEGGADRLVGDVQHIQRQAHRLVEEGQLLHSRQVNLTKGILEKGSDRKSQLVESGLSEWVAYECGR